MALGRKTGGRVKGTPNKVNGDLRGMIVGALAGVGGQEYLMRQAEQNPIAFMGLIGRVLPFQMTGENGAPIAVDFRWADATEPPAPPTIDAESDTMISEIFAETADVDGN
jgi:hypothetical protein